METSEFDLYNWLKMFKEAILSEFKDEVLFIGYQGSYRRGDASDDSDIDMVVILDNLELGHLKRYKNIVSKMPHKEKCCGFIGGKKELYNWTKFELFQFVQDTETLFGNMEKHLPHIERKDIEIAVKSGACNLYHAASHSFLYDENRAESLCRLYKGTFFVIQAKHYLESGNYISSKTELLSALKEMDKEVLYNCIHRKEIVNFSCKKIEDGYHALIQWSSTLIKQF